jgi:hypothetical protein
VQVVLILSIPSPLLVAVVVPPGETAWGRRCGRAFPTLRSATEAMFLRPSRITCSTPDWVMPHPSSTTFWGLMDRWDVSNDQALELVGYEGKLPTTTERRPRFRLSTEQAHIVTTLLEVDSALATAGLDPSWLHKPSGTGSRSPLDLMRAGAMDGVLRSLTQATLLASVQKKAR